VRQREEMGFKTTAKGGERWSNGDMLTTTMSSNPSMIFAFVLMTTKSTKKFAAN